MFASNLAQSWKNTGLSCSQSNETSNTDWLLLQIESFSLSTSCLMHISSMTGINRSCAITNWASLKPQNRSSHGQSFRKSLSISRWRWNDNCDSFSTDDRSRNTSTSWAKGEVLESDSPRTAFVRRLILGRRLTKPNLSQILSFRVSHFYKPARHIDQ